MKCNTTTLAKLVLSAIVWHIWKESNVRIFQNERQNKLQVFKSIYADVQLLMDQCKWKGTMQGPLNSTLNNWGIIRPG